MKKIKLLTGIAIISVLGFIAIQTLQVKAGYPGLTTGQMTITAKGTPEQMLDLDIEEDLTLVIKAMTSNTGIVYVGDTSAKALNTNSEHFKLYSGESIELNISNASYVWLDAETGEGVEYIVEK